MWNWNNSIVEEKIMISRKKYGRGLNCGDFSKELVNYGNSQEHKATNYMIQTALKWMAENGVLSS